MIIRLDHIAVAVPNLSDSIRRFCEDLGLTLAGREDVASALTSTAFLPVPGTRIELVHPLEGQGPIQKFLEKKPQGGLHHLCFATDDLDGDVARLRGLGYAFTSEHPNAGAHGARVIFLHPRGFDGVLIELAEYPPAHSESS
jgi:methylmalonyl-CoA epimerase